MFVIMNIIKSILFFTKNTLTNVGGGGYNKAVQNSEYNSQIRIREEREIWGYPKLQLRSCL